MSFDPASIFGGAHPLWSGLWLCCAVFLSAFVRGFSGFGSSALLVSAGSLILSPRIVVPMSLALEIVASLHMLPWVWREVSWRILLFLCIGMAITAPLGIAVLASAPSDLLRILIAIVILVVCAALWRGARLNWAGPVTHTAAGAVSGFANGLGAVGGLPLVAYFLSTGTSGAVMRATLVAYLLIADSYASGLAGAAGIYDQQLMWLIALSLPILAVGVWLGHRYFLRTDAERFRRATIVLLVLLSLLTLLRALL